MKLYFFLQNFLYLPAVENGKKYCEGSIKYCEELFHSISVVDKEITVGGVWNECKGGLISKLFLVKSQRKTYQECGVKRRFKKIVINSSFRISLQKFPFS